MRSSVMLFGLVALAGCGAPPSGSGDAGSDAPAAAVEPLKVTSQELGRAYEDNEVAAQQTYGDKPLEVSGTIRSIQLDFMDNPVLSLRGANEFSNVMANLGEEGKAVAGRLSRGQEVTVNCTEVKEVIGSPILDGCRVQ